MFRLAPLLSRSLSAPSCLFLLWVLGGDGRLGASEAVSCSQWSRTSSQGVFQDGDVIIGGLLSFHYRPPPVDQDFTQPPFYPACTGLDLLSLQSLYGMMFSLEEINRNTTLLPGVRLGFRVLDSCGQHLWALRAALSLAGGQSSSCNSTATPQEPGAAAGGQAVPLIIGGASSTTAKIISTFLGPLSVPVISYIASCPCLSDRQKFPNFFRTIPSDIYQVRVMAELAVRFHWTWIGAVIPNTEYGQSGIKVLKEEIRGKRVCLDFVATIKRETISRDAKRAAETIEASSARVIIIFCWYTDVRRIFQELAKRNVTDRQFIASEAWSTSADLLRDVGLSAVSAGVLGVAIRSSTIPGFEQYLRRLHPSHRYQDDLLVEFWEKVFGCSPVAARSRLEAPLPPCSGSESLEDLRHPFTDASRLRMTYNVYVAAYAAAHALHRLLSCSGGPSNSSGPACSPPQNISPAELLSHLDNLDFTTPQGEVFYFRGGDFPARYDLVNWQTTGEGPLKLVLIGQVDGFNLILNQSAIQWSSGSNQVPTSVCTESCQPGTREATRRGQPKCCFDCVACAEGEISNTTGSHLCEQCPSDFWSNDERTACVLRQVDFLSFSDDLGITLTTVATSGAVVTAVVLVVFLRYRHTPMVRANNSELSFLLLVSLKLCFLCSLVFIGRPSVWSCRLQQAAFGISFALSVSCLLVKTIVVLVAFRSARPGAEALIRWFGPCQQRGSVCFLTGVQIIICTVWLSISPPEPQRDLGLRGSKVTLECATNSVVGFALVLGYIGLLAFICLLLAFLARKLPDTFNEAKLITFSMLIFCAVWVAFVPAYVSSPGKYIVAVEIFAILASSYGLLFCIFAPKCFIILLRPEKNTKKHLMAR